MDGPMSLTEHFHKRGRLTTLYEMLTICQKGPVKKTHLMYRANLSHDQLQKFLQVLLDKELCVEDTSETRSLYHITMKGNQFLRAFQRLTQLIESSTPSEPE